MGTQINLRTGPNWVDYGNLAVNIAQTRQLQHVQQQLADLRKIEENREARNQLENQLRQYVFELEEQLDDIAVNQSKAPLAANILSRVVIASLDDIGIYPSSFEQFVDKDRIKQVRQKADNLVRTSAGSLGTNVGEADICVQFIQEMVDLDRIIGALNDKVEIAKIEQVLKNGIPKYKKMRVYTLLFFLFILILPAFFLTVLSQVPVAIIIVWLAALLGSAYTFGAMEMPEPLKMQENRRDELIAKFPKDSQFTKWQNQFGNYKTAEDYERVRDTRKKRILNALNNDKNGNPLLKDAS